MKVKYALLGLVLFIFSCGPRTIYKEYEEMPDYVWQTSDVKSFSFSIENPEQAVDASIILRHITNCPYAAILVVVESATLGSEFNEKVVIPIRSEEGKLIGDGSGDYWDIEFPLAKNITLSKGVHTVSLRAVNTYQLINDIGIKITNAEVLESK